MDETTVVARRVEVDAPAPCLVVFGPAAPHADASARARRAERRLRVALAGSIGVTWALLSGASATGGALLAVALALTVMAASFFERRRAQGPQTIDLRGAEAQTAAHPPTSHEEGLRSQLGLATAATHPPAPFPPLCRVLKRGIDIVLGATALVAALPLLGVAAFMIARESPGGWLFRQTRLGMNGRPFTVYKLRTMRCGTDDAAHRDYVAALMRGEAPRIGGLFKLVDDPRITPVGRWLRRFSIDEVPQLLNVLRGDMSLVGPRPPLPGEAGHYDARTWQRLRCKPGMTGLWQVSGRSRVPFDRMVDLDISYWREWTPLLDLRILARTVAVVALARDGA